MNIYAIITLALLIFIVLLIILIMILNKVNRSKSIGREGGKK